MSDKNKQSLADINVDEIIFQIFKIIIIVCIIGFSLWVYFGVYKPKEKNYIKHTRNAYRLIEKEAKEIFRRDGQIYTDKDEKDILCEALAKKYSRFGGKCNVSKRSGLLPNFNIGKTKVTIYGMNMPAYFYDGTFVKDIIIDVDGDKGENALGIDRTPVRIYSSGRMGGMLSPVNCKIEDKKRYDMHYSHICPNGADINFFDSKIPLSYNILQVGGKHGESKYVGKNISFLRADCAAYGSELLGVDEFCTQRGYQWLTACYHDYYCAIELSKD